MHESTLQSICRLCIATGLICAFLGACSPTVDVADKGRLPLVHGDVEAAKPIVATLCKSCHGVAGISPVPLFPNLAGQDADYLHRQLLRFKSGVLTESPMTAVAALVGADDLANLAAYYAAMPPPEQAEPIADRAAFDRGAVLFRDGDPTNGVTPCQACHGANAQGSDAESDLRGVPHLRHQKAGYLIGKLNDDRSHKLDATSADMIMPAIAAQLDDASIAALAAWIASAP